MNRDASCKFKEVRVKNLLNIKNNRKIIESECHILRLNCTKFDSGCGSQTPTSKEREWMEKQGNEGGRWERMKGMER